MYVCRRGGGERGGGEQQVSVDNGVYRDGNLMSVGRVGWVS